MLSAFSITRESSPGRGRCGVVAVRWQLGCAVDSAGQEGSRDSRRLDPRHSFHPGYGAEKFQVWNCGRIPHFVTSDRWWNPLGHKKYCERDAPEQALCQLGVEPSEINEMNVPLRFHVTIASTTAKSAGTALGVLGALSRHEPAGNRTNCRGCRAFNQLSKRFPGLMGVCKLQNGNTHFSLLSMDGIQLSGHCATPGVPRESLVKGAEGPDRQVGVLPTAAQGVHVRQEERGGTSRKVPLAWAPQ